MTADPATLPERQTLLADYLVKGWPALGIPGLPRVSAAAAVGNATQENSAKSVTTGTLDHGSNGEFQWRNSGNGDAARLTNMQEFGVKNFGTWESIEAEAAFFADECKRLYPSLWADLTAGTKPLATLTANICDEYERPSVEGRVLDTRIKYATDFLNAWAVPAAPAPIPSSPPAPQAITMDPIALNALVMFLEPIAVRVLAPLAEAMFAGMIGGVIKQLPAATQPAATAASANLPATLEAIVAEVIKQLQPPKAA